MKTATYPIFKQNRAVYGYGWLTAEQRSFPNPVPSGQAPVTLLLPLDADGTPALREYVSTAYSPFGKSELYRKFADLDTSNRDELLKFANTYGLIECATQGRRNGELYTGDSLARLVSAVEDIQRAVGLMDALNNLTSENKSVRDAGLAYLKAHIDWQRNRIALDYTGEPVTHSRSGFDFQEHILHESIPSDAHEYYLPGRTDRVRGAKLCLQKWINEHLTNQLNARILWERKDSGEEKMVLAVEPVNLLACMWYQLAARLAGVSIRACAWCGKPLAEDSAPKKLFCSDNCRTYRNRRRKKDAAV